MIRQVIILVHCSDYLFFNFFCTNSGFVGCVSFAENKILIIFDFHLSMIMNLTQAIMCAKKNNVVLLLFSYELT